MAAFVSLFAVSGCKVTSIKTCKLVWCVVLHRSGDKQFAGQLVLACPQPPSALLDRQNPKAWLTIESLLKVFVISQSHDFQRAKVLLRLPVISINKKSGTFFIAFLKLLIKVVDLKCATWKNN